MHDGDTDRTGSGGKGQGEGSGACASRQGAIVDCGWGRVLFAQTFTDPATLAEAIRAEGPDRRDIAFYVTDPHVTLAAAPQELFLDPSHTFRLTFDSDMPAAPEPSGYRIRPIETRADGEAINAIYANRGMVTVPPEYFWGLRERETVRVLLAEDAESGTILGSVMGIDHAAAFGDEERGSSLWCLAVSPNCPYPGVGQSLVRALAATFRKAGCTYLDLSVMHDNEQAIGLYDKLGFRRVAVYTVKRKNPINEPLFVGGMPSEELNPYATIIVDEARRRGIAVEVTDAASGLFRLRYGGRSVHCRESLSEFTSAVAMAICDDKRLTRRLVSAAGVNVPEQMEGGDADARAAFLEKHGSVVVKPARGEQGSGVAVGLTTAEAVEKAVEAASRLCPDVILESYFEGDDLRLIVIDHIVVAAALRRPARIVGNGESTCRKLIETQSRRRSAATGGESRIPLDEETERCLNEAGYGLDDVPPKGEEIEVRKTANLHTGGTIHDVTGETHPVLIDAAIAASRAIEIPVTGIDLMVKSPREPDYVFIEANERPGLANHEPQPTAERFIDLLFPLSVPASIRGAQQRRAARRT